MRTKQRSLMAALAILMVVQLIACAKAPPNLSPAGVTAFNQTRVVKGLDLLRDTAVSANAQLPPLVTTDTTRKIVQYHQAALLTIQASADGWKAAVAAGLDGATASLSSVEQQTLAPYIALVKTILQAVQ